MNVKWMSRDAAEVGVHEMCVVSMVAEHYRDKWYPQSDNMSWTITTPVVSQAEFDALKREVENMKALLKRAKEYDERNGEPDCEMDEKVALVKKVAEMVGVSLDDVL